MTAKPLHLLLPPEAGMEAHRTACGRRVTITPLPLQIIYLRDVQTGSDLEGTSISAAVTCHKCKKAMS